MAELRPLFLDTGSIEVVHGNRIVDYMHFPVTASVSSSYSTLLPDPYLFATTSVNITNAVNTTSSSLFELRVPGRTENYFYAHNSIVGVQTSATTTGVRIGLQTDARADAIANIKVSSTLTAHTIACVGSFSATTFALPATMAAINTVYPCFVKGLYNNSTASLSIKNVVLLQPETNNTVTANSGSVSYNKFIGYKSDLLNRGFDTGTGFNSGIESIAIQTDGKIVVGGDFITYNGTTQNRITRLNSDGTRDTGFNIGTGFDNFVSSIATQSDGKILVGGSFTTYSGSTQNYITRLNSDGTRDTGFTIGTGFTGDVRSIAIQTDGKIVVGGFFTSYNGTTQNRITRLFSELKTNEKSIPLYLSTGSLKLISGSDTVTSSFLPVTSSLWLSQSLATSVANTSNTVYATVFTLTGLTTGKRYLAQLYMIGLSAAAGTGFRMRVINGNNYRGTLYTPTSVTAPAIQNSADGANITSITAGAWPIGNTKYIVHGDYTFVKAATDPQVQILSETNGTAVTAVSGSVIFYRALD